jgi:hypothetical protein
MRPGYRDRRNPRAAELESRVARLASSVRRLRAPRGPERDAGAADKAWDRWDVKLLGKVLEELREQHREALQDWRDIESKAQATAATAGAAIAVLAAFIRDRTTAPPTTHAVDGVLLGFATLFAMLSMLLALNVLLVRRIAFADLAAQMKEDGMRILESGEIPDRTAPLLHDLVQSAELNASEYGRIHEEKARALGRAQVLLGFSLVVLAIFTCWTLAR